LPLSYRRHEPPAAATGVAAFESGDRVAALQTLRVSGDPLRQPGTTGGVAARLECGNTSCRFPTGRHGPPGAATGVAAFESGDRVAALQTLRVSGGPLQ
jgi:hypothetical protein